MIESLGMGKADSAISQAIDLQHMHGNQLTVPALLFETCGIALVNIAMLSQQTGLVCHGQGMILIISTREKLIQLLKIS